MPLKTPLEYVDSLRALKINAYVGAEKIDSPVDHPALAPHINTASNIYALAQYPKYEGLMTTNSQLTGREINRFTHELSCSTIEFHHKINCLSAKKACIY